MVSRHIILGLLLCFVAYPTFIVGLVHPCQGLCFPALAYHGVVLSCYVVLIGEHHTAQAATPQRQGPSPVPIPSNVPNPYESLGRSSNPKKKGKGKLKSGIPSSTSTATNGAGRPAGTKNRPGASKPGPNANTLKRKAAESAAKKNPITGYFNRPDAAPAAPAAPSSPEATPSSASANRAPSQDIRGDGDEACPYPDECCEDRSMFAAMFREIEEETGVRLFDATDTDATAGGVELEALALPEGKAGRVVWDSKAINLAVADLLQGCAAQGNVLGMDCEWEPPFNGSSESAVCTLQLALPDGTSYRPFQGAPLPGGGADPDAYEDDFFDVPRQMEMSRATLEKMMTVVTTIPFWAPCGFR